MLEGDDNILFVSHLRESLIVLHFYVFHVLKEAGVDFILQRIHGTSLI